jgi:hypothetical protein
MDIGKGCSNASRGGNHRGKVAYLGCVPHPVTASSRSVLSLAMLSFVLFWAGLLLHEGAHFAAASLLLTPADWAGDVFRPTRSAIVAGAGPLTSVAIIAVCAAVARRAHERLFTVAYTGALGAASRLALVAIPTLLHRSNDERGVSVATGVPAIGVWAIEAAVTAALLVWMARGRQAGWDSRLLLPITCGVITGWISALTIGRAIGLPV